jgi:peptidoglycan hydrolase-like protein with peptidoglycan-binding domain
MRANIKRLVPICLLLFLSVAPGSAQQSQTLYRSQIKEAEQRLSALGYWTGTVDGRFDVVTRSALVAFQKWEGRPITGRLSSEELDAIRNGSSPTARESGYEHVEVDVDRQVLLLVDERGAVKVLPVSTGSETNFVELGATSIAHTPRGRFIVYDKVAGWDLPGQMYYSSYISGGVAIHGHPNVPNQPASHGCVRVPIFAARELSRLTPVGTIVLVYDKVSFVSARPWVEYPHLKQAVLASSIASGFDDSNYQADAANEPKSFSRRKTHLRITRA